MHFYQKLLGGFLLLFTAVNVSHLYSADYNTPADLRNVYLGALLWNKHLNPYDDSTLKNEWYTICDQEGIDKASPPGLPQNFLVYPPHALLLYTPLSWFSWKQAVWINAILMLTSLFLIIYMLVKMVPEQAVNLLLLFLFIFAFKGTVHALRVGQPSFLCNALALGGIYLSLYRNKKALPPMLIALASFKPTMLLPYVLFLAWHRQWKMLLISGILSLALVGFSLLYWGDAQQLLHSALENIHGLKQFVFASDSIYIMTTGTELGLVITYLSRETYQVHQYLYLAILAACAYFLYKRRNDLSDMYVLTFCVVVTLLTSHHLFYDVLFLLPLLFLLPSFTLKTRIVLAALCLPFFIPINGLLNALHVSENWNIFYMLFPFCLSGILIVLLRNPVRKNPVVPTSSTAAGL